METAFSWSPRPTRRGTRPLRRSRLTLCFLASTLQLGSDSGRRGSPAGTEPAGRLQPHASPPGPGEGAGGSEVFPFFERRWSGSPCGHPPEAGGALADAVGGTTSSMRSAAPPSESPDSTSSRRVTSPCRTFPQRSHESFRLIRPSGPCERRAQQLDLGEVRVERLVLEVDKWRSR